MTVHTEMHKCVYLLRNCLALVCDSPIPYSPGCLISQRGSVYTLVTVDVVQPAVTACNYNQCIITSFLNISTITTMHTHGWCVCLQLKPSSRMFQECCVVSMVKKTSLLVLASGVCLTGVYMYV